MCLRFQFCTHQRVCVLYFLKKSQIRCTLIRRLPYVPKNINNLSFYLLSLHMLNKSSVLLYVTYRVHGYRTNVLPL
jgi:hypothetical protein